MEEQFILTKYVQDLASVLSLKASQLPGRLIFQLILIANNFIILTTKYISNNTRNLSET